MLILLVVLASCKKQTGQGDVIPDTSDNAVWPTENTRTVKADLTQPWEMLWGKDDHIWITERVGKVMKVNPKTGYTVFKAIIPDVVQKGEGGLLGMAHHPEFLQNGLLFVAYNYEKAGVYAQKLVRFRLQGESLTEPLTLIDNIPAAIENTGSRLAITPDGKLLMTTGDATQSESAQQVNAMSGKVLRFNLDGSIPADNPFPGSPVWTIGHSNSQGLAFVNGNLFASENGIGIQDEVNLIERGRNYGWPNPGVGEKSTIAPLWSSGINAITASGMEYYNSELIGRWKNSILMTSMKENGLFQLRMNATGTAVESVTPFYQGQWGRLRDVCISPAGRVYICTGNGEGTDRIIEIQQ